MSSISSSVKGSPKRQQRITLCLDKYSFQGWQTVLLFPCKDLLSVLTQRRKGAILRIQFLHFCQCESHTLSKLVSGKGDRGAGSSALLSVHWLWNSPFLCHRDFETTIFARVNSSNVYIRIIIFHLAILSLVFTSWKASGFSLSGASKLLMAYCIPHWEQGPHLRIGLAQSLHIVLDLWQAGVSQPCKKSRLFKGCWGLHDIQLKSGLWIFLFAYGTRIKIKIMQEWISTETTWNMEF